MMVRRMTCSLMMLAYCAGTVARGAEPSAKAVLERAIKAHGRATTAKAKTQSWTAKGTMELMGLKITYDATYVFAGPDKFRIDATMEFGGMKMDLTAVGNGKQAWEKSGEILRDMDEAKAKEFRHGVYVVNVSQLHPLLDKAFELKSLGESKEGDRALVGIKVSRKGERDVSLYFDKKTGLLAKSATRIVDEFSGKEVAQETVFEDYRDNDGVKVFDKMIVKRAGKQFMVEELSNYKVSTKLDEKLFEKPKKE